MAGSGGLEWVNGSGGWGRERTYVDFQHKDLFKKTTNWQLENCDEDAKYGMGNTVNRIVIAVYVRCQVGTGNIGGTLCKLCER